MYQSRWRKQLFVWGGWVLFTLFLTYGPASFYTRIQSVVLNGTGLSLSMIDQAQAWFNSPKSVTSEPQSEPTGNDAAITQLQQRNQDLAALVAVLKSENQRLKEIPEIPSEQSSNPLRSISALSANVIGRQGKELAGNHRLLIALGEKHGLVGNEFLLQGEGVLIDKGLQFNLTRDQLIVFGKALFGRTVDVGFWTSLVQPLTDLEFRTGVQLFRKSDFGLVSGAHGILKGTGTGCEIIEVAGTEAVAVGDLVYTDTHLAGSTTLIYCGRVTQASIDANSPHWTILVQPATSIVSLPSTFSVIRTELNLSEMQD